MPSAKDVETALGEMNKARTKAQDMCAEFAQTETGWEVGDHVRTRRGVTVEVVGFTGVHPQTWGIGPLVLAQIVRKDGKRGAHPMRLKIDTEGHWRFRYRPDTRGDYVDDIPF